MVAQQYIEMKYRLLIQYFCLIESTREHWRIRITCSRRSRRSLTKKSVVLQLFFLKVCKQKERK